MAAPTESIKRLPSQAHLLRHVKLDLGQQKTWKPGFANAIANFRTLSEHLRGLGVHVSSLHLRNVADPSWFFVTGRRQSAELRLPTWPCLQSLVLEGFYDTILQVTTIRQHCLESLGLRQAFPQLRTIKINMKRWPVGADNALESLPVVAFTVDLGPLFSRPPPL